MPLLSNTVGRKLLMAATGLVMLLFVIVHLLGNSSIFVGPDGINAYAEKLHSLGALVWIFRAVMFAMLAIHVWFGIQLTLENRAANPALRDTWVAVYFAPVPSLSSSVFRYPVSWRSIATKLSWKSCCPSTGSAPTRCRACNKRVRQTTPCMVCSTSWYWVSTAW